ncbi:hypothetical protein [Salsuginibacillus kocurii]|uniref:hypothetical protein n=1 Tax=Salsuginibacillus kocurii TaxID=427078 RepID=UPI00038282B7|nr:hypothetical protein [Salsuginibacillus kocurii]
MKVGFLSVSIVMFMVVWGGVFLLASPLENSQPNEELTEDERKALADELDDHYNIAADDREDEPSEGEEEPRETAFADEKEDEDEKETSDETKDQSEDRTITSDEVEAISSDGSLTIDEALELLEE